jgi:hypothetical protein
VLDRVDAVLDLDGDDLTPISCDQVDLGATNA